MRDKEKKNGKVTIYLLVLLLIVSFVFLCFILYSAFVIEPATQQYNIVHENLVNEESEPEDFPDEEIEQPSAEPEEVEIPSVEEGRSEWEILEEEIDEIIAGLSLEDKVSQLFFVRANDPWFGFSIGGVILFSGDIVDEDQLRGLNTSLQEGSSLPLFIGVDEEGGPTVARVANSAIDVPTFPSMLEVGNTGDPRRAFEVGDTIGEYLRELGFNVNFAPVADVFSNPENTVIGARSFGPQYDVVSTMVVEVVRGLQGQGISATLKHFPGHGDTYEDSHFQLAVSYRSLEELRRVEFLPFIAGIQEGVDMIMTGHVAVPTVTGSYVPATLSPMILQEILRDELGFDGIIISDAMNMGAIVNQYGSGEAAVLFLQAGGDMILMPQDFQGAWQGVFNAIERGELTEERIDESLRRILRVKMRE